MVVPSQWLEEHTAVVAAARASPHTLMARMHTLACASLTRVVMNVCQLIDQEMAVT